MSLSIARRHSALARVLLLVLYLATFLLLNRFAGPLFNASSFLLWNPGAGLNFALLFGLGPGLAPVVLLATLAALSSNPGAPSSLSAWVIMALISTVGYSLAAVLLRRVLNAASQLKRVSDVLAFVGVALAAPAVIGLFVMLDLRSFGLIPGVDLLTAWRDYWIGDVIGITTFAPFLLLHVVAPVGAFSKGEPLSQPVMAPLAKWSRANLSLNEWGQILVEATSCAVVLWIAFWTTLGQELDVLFLWFLPVHWIALRRGLSGATIGILVLSVGALLAAQGGTFPQTSMANLHLQVIMLALSVSGLYLGAYVEERRESQRELRKSEGLYRNLAHNFPNGGVFLFDRDLRYTLVDGAGLARAGLSKSLLEGKTIWEIFPPELCCTLEPHYRAALAGRESTLEMQYGDRTYHVFTIPIHDEQGNILAAMAITQDVTDRVRSHLLLEDRVVQRTSEIKRLLEAEQYRAEQMRVIHDLGQRVTSTHTVDEILGMTAQLIREAFGYYHVHLGLIEGQVVTFKPTAGVWYEDLCCDRCASLRLKVGAEGMCGWVAGTGEPLLVPDVTLDSRFVSVEGIRTGAALVMPLKYQAQVIGTLEMETERPGGFDESDVPVLQALVNQVAVAIENARLYEQASQRMRELQALYDADEALYSSLKLEHVLNTLVDKATELLRSDKSTVMVWDKTRERLIVGAARGFSPDMLPQMVHSRGEGITSLVATTGRPIAVEDAESDTRVARRITDVEGIRSLMHVPITIGGEIFGVFGVNYCERHSFTEEEHRILTALAKRAAVAIQNARLFDQAQQAVLLEERQRLARELHDSVSQALYGIALGARTARAQLARAPGRASEPLDYVLSLTDAALAEMRALIFELRPESLETEGLVAALTKQAAAVRARHGLKVQTVLGDEPKAPIEVKQALYRIAQEALQNTIKHSHAKCVEMQLVAHVDKISLGVSDDGIGFDPERSYPGHFGLHSMQERAARLGGTLQVTSEQDRGTRVSVQFPITSKAVR